jgi:hypothetical protein
VLEHRGVRFTEVSDSTQCPIYDSGPVDEAALAVAMAELAVLSKLPVTPGTCAICTCGSTRRSAPRRSSWRRTCGAWRGRAVPRLRERPRRERRQGVQSAAVLVEWKVLGGPRVLTNIESFADKESCDAWFTADVFDFHLAPGDEHHSGLLDHLNKLYVVGDHGPHFSANNTLLNESTFFRRYCKVVECVFLCS